MLPYGEPKSPGRTGSSIMCDGSEGNSPVRHPCTRFPVVNFRGDRPALQKRAIVIRLVNGEGILGLSKTCFPGPPI